MKGRDLCVMLNIVYREPVDIARAAFWQFGRNIAKGVKFRMLSKFVDLRYLPPNQWN